MFSTYEEALLYLYANVPVFQRVGASAYKADLTNTLKLCAAVDNPQSKFKSIHVAGTNGKGSTSHMLASILQSSGYKTGLYTSPHLKEFTERIRINGEEVNRQFVLNFVNHIRPVIDVIKPSFFEVTVVMAFAYFVQQNIDIAVIEVGLGGRLDSTNVITPVLSVITNIGLDHTDLLGDTLEKIAYEKAGIIKNTIPVIISERQTATENIFKAVADEKNSSLYFATDDYKVTSSIVEGQWVFNAWKQNSPFFENLQLPLQGFYQQKNITGVLKAVELLNEAGYSIDKQNLLRGLTNVITHTKLKGRWQKLGESPLIICDTGHNAEGMREVVQQIRAQRFKKLHMVLGMVKDKDIRSMLALLPKNARYYFCQAKIPRALNASLLAEQAKEFGLHGSIINDVNNALQEAKALASADDFIFIGGSTFVVAEIENL